MTNGEKLRETFPNVRITEFESYICVMGENYEFNNAYPKKWWNAEYKEAKSKDCLAVEYIVDEVVKRVTPIRPKGHWIEERNDYGEIEHWHCSNCYDDSGFITTCKWHYCPECGSDNREVEKNDKRRSDRKY